jgi:predicted RNase H-like nuclease (RuvC/YqgF family)
LQREREAFEAEVERLRREQQEQQQREEGDERKRAERHQRHCVELEQEVQKRKAEYHKNQTIKQHLSEAKKQIVKLETELAGTRTQRDELERDMRKEKQRHEQLKMKGTKDRKAISKRYEERIEALVVEVSENVTIYRNISCLSCIYTSIYSAIASSCSPLGSFVLVYFLLTYHSGTMVQTK